MNPTPIDDYGKPLYLALTLKKRLLLLLLAFIICFFIVSVISVIVQLKTGLASVKAVRMVTIVQDIVMFVMPPLITAMLVTRQPASLLAVDRKPGMSISLLMVLVLVLSVPAMNYVIYLNDNMPLPQSLAKALRAMEDNAAGMVDLMTGAHNIPNLIVTILIVGVLAGVSEELLFRGGLQRMLVTGGVNAHAAIWVTAAVFSLMHMQFYGFVPRMLLGAGFGYALYWSRSLWLPILLHTLNNTAYVLSVYMSDGEQQASSIDNIGTESPALVVVSALLTAGVLYFAHRLSTGQEQNRH